MPSQYLFNNGTFQIEEYLDPHTRAREVRYSINEEYYFEKNEFDEFVAAFIAVGNSDRKPSETEKIQPH